ncbi:MAG TPA: metallophosphoesterase [Candidatus Angelobacter sp.]|jgi:predicted MPP superfamily phosphohydrolase|nr:metallophosphoesterase [Candidatus Angelobacter sp.]
MTTRRNVLKSLFAAAALTGLYTWRWEPHWLEFTYPTLPIRGLPENLHGRTLAQITDTHIGPLVDDNYVVESFRRTQEQSPDFVVFTGDWITYRGEAQLDQLRRVVAHFPHGRLGTVGILGNHDYGRGWRRHEVADEVSRIASDAGVKLLRNQATEIGGLHFVGLDDFWGPNFNPAPVLAESVARNSSLATLVLCHNPDVADEPVWGNYEGWMLCGHTHGGQCKPPFLPPPELPVRNKRYTAGKFGLSGNRNMYISRGVGHLLQVRFNARPEIPIFRLQRTEA